MIWQIISSSVLFLTFLAVVYYACETRKLRLETFKQRELSLRPFVILSWESSEYKIKNIGYGPALSIQVDDICLPVERGSIFKCTFLPVDIIPPNKELKLDIRDGEGRTARELHLNMITPHSAPKDLEFSISYSNIENKAYKTHGKIGKSGVIIEGTK